MTDMRMEPHTFVGSIFPLRAPRQCERCNLREDQPIHDRKLMREFASARPLFAEKPKHPLSNTVSGFMFRVQDRTEKDRQTLTELVDLTVLDSIKEAEAKLSAEADAYILDFFGSLEVAKLLAPYFIVEESRPEMFSDFDIDHDSMIFQSSMTIRIRPKTQEELKNDGLV